MRLLYISLLVMLFNCCAGQPIDNTSAFKNISNSNYFRFHYDNDYFTKTDEYYSQGITLEYVHPDLRKFLLSRLLFKPKQSEIKYGLRVDHFAYTPTSIRHNDILYGDRPFCGNLALTSFAIATDTTKQQHISASFIAGIMGPGAGGKEMQVTIHRWLKNTIPSGWQYQIANDIILDYKLGYEKKLWSYRNLFLINSAAELRIGTHTDKITAGFNFMAGNFTDPYLSINNTKQNRKKFRYYLYGQLQPGIVGYDATLQGGLFNHNSPYIVAAKDITRTTLQGDYGIVVSFRKIYLEYCQSILTKEFSTGTFHRWGGIRIAVAL